MALVDLTQSDDFFSYVVLKSQRDDAYIESRHHVTHMFDLPAPMYQRKREGGRAKKRAIG